MFASKEEKFNYQVRIIQNAEQELSVLNRLRHFLYHKYITQYQWVFAPDNPSRIKIENSSTNTPLLVDENDLRATWFYIEHQQEIVACARVVSPGHDHQFEVQRYEAAKPVKFQELFATCTKLYEINREAYQDESVLRLLLLEICLYYKQRNTALFAIACDVRTKNFYQQVGFPEQKSYEFKYESTDKETSQLYLVRECEIDNLIASIKQQLNPVASDKSNSMKM